jgi:hypothetical protein
MILEVIMRRCLFSAAGLFALAAGILLLPGCRRSQLESLKAQIQTLEAEGAGLKKQIEEKTKALVLAQDEISGFPATLPVSHDASAGESHWQISLDYLLSRGLGEEQARAVLGRTQISPFLLVGQKVWNYYSDGDLLTSVTQGSAPISASAMARQDARKRAEELTGLEKALAASRAEVEELKASLAGKEKEAAALQARVAQIPGLERAAADLRSRIQGLEATINSVHYLTGSKASLKGTGKVRGSFLNLCGTRIADVTVGDFTSHLDLRASTVIELKAADLGLASIRTVEILPWRFVEGRDYRVDILDGGQTARVSLLDASRFVQALLVLMAK